MKMIDDNITISGIEFKASLECPQCGELAVTPYTHEGAPVKCSNCGWRVEPDVYECPRCRALAIYPEWDGKSDCDNCGYTTPPEWIDPRPPPRPKQNPGWITMGRDETQGEKWFRRALFAMMIIACIGGMVMVLWLMWQECGGIC